MGPMLRVYVRRARHLGGRGSKQRLTEQIHGSLRPAPNRESLKDVVKSIHKHIHKHSSLYNYAILECWLP